MPDTEPAKTVEARTSVLSRHLEKMLEIPGAEKALGAEIVKKYRRALALSKARAEYDSKS